MECARRLLAQSALPVLSEPDGRARRSHRTKWRGARMTKRISAAGRAEDGFTVIELLVVVLIIGILAAVALPSFLNQKNKAIDASAKELAHSAQIAAETYATDHNGSYSA